MRIDEAIKAVTRALLNSALSFKASTTALAPSPHNKHSRIMRQRITYFQEPNDSIDPKLLKVTADSISTNSIKAAREERITVGLTEGLPFELYSVLKSSHELHIRWVSEEDYESLSPLVARLSPGLHVFYTPRTGKLLKDEKGGIKNGPSLCQVLQKVFGEMDCISPDESFTTLPTERFSHSTTHQYYTRLPSLKPLSDYIHHKVCASLPPTLQTPCLIRLSSLNDATNLDISYTSISHALTLSASYPPSVQPISITNPSTSRLEVGVLSISPPNDPSELSLGGFLTVLGEDDHPKPTLFSFPSRHHPTTSTFSSEFLSPTGLHPTLSLTISSPKPPSQDKTGTCKLHAHLTLPKEIFLDRHQFSASNALFLASNNLSALHHITQPLDLEGPAYTETKWGSSALIELSPPSSSSAAFTARIPTHLRYLPPTHNSSGLTPISIPYPAVFWACTAAEGSKFTVNPFDRVHLGWDGLFGVRSVFYHLSPEPVQGESLVMPVTVPVLDLDGARWVEVGTAGAVVLGLMWVGWCLFKVWLGAGYGSGSESGEAKEKAKRKKKN